MVRRMFALLFVALITGFGVLWNAHTSAHWLRRVSAAAVKVDECPVRADLYVGHRDRDRAVALLHVLGIGDYVLDFKAKEYREAVDYECIRFRGGVWSFPSLLNNSSPASAPSHLMLQFRSTNGHTITVQL